MARFKEWRPDPSDDGDDYGTQEIRDVLWGPAYDAQAQDLMFNGIVQDNPNALQDLKDYLWDFYGIDLERDWHWDDFREWYAAQ
jgi:hypothetical protein